jgi:hypothetical protein
LFDFVVYAGFLHPPQDLKTAEDWDAFISRLKITTAHSECFRKRHFTDDGKPVEVLDGRRLCCKPGCEKYAKYVSTMICVVGKGVV